MHSSLECHSTHESHEPLENIFGGLALALEKSESDILYTCCKSVFREPVQNSSSSLLPLLRMGQALTATEAEEFMREADLNGDGKLDYDEFSRIMSQSISKPLQYFVS